MNQASRFPLWLVVCVGAFLSWSAAAQPTSSACDQAWASYNEFKQRNVMEPSQYALTVQGAAVRSACGAEALPVPPGTDTPLMPIIRKPKPRPTPPPPPPAPRPPGTP
jgi:hypothetical protein